MTKDFPETRCFQLWYPDSTARRLVLRHKQSSIWFYYIDQPSLHCWNAANTVAVQVGIKFKVKKKESLFQEIISEYHLREIIPVDLPSIGNRSQPMLCYQCKKGTVF